jgi:hypothetical protein
MRWKTSIISTGFLKINIASPGFAYSREKSSLSKQTDLFYILLFVGFSGGIFP